MDKDWRPPGWKNPYIPRHTEVVFPDEVFEAGASAIIPAILEKLKQEGWLSPDEVQSMLNTLAPATEAVVREATLKEVASLMKRTVIGEERSVPNNTEIKFLFMEEYKALLRGEMPEEG